MSLPTDNPRPCPWCQGACTVYDVTHQRQDNKCFYCAGLGVISDRMCYCGRPLVWYIGAFASCNAKGCFDKAMDAEQARIDKVAPSAKVLSYPPNAI
jgi:hypothetical protein